MEPERLPPNLIDFSFRFHRLYSRPFGIEKDGTVRCVLRVLVVMRPNEDVFQFALEVLYATKYKRKFDFR